MGNGCRAFKIDYQDKTRRFTGRNGYMKQYGLNVWYMVDNDNCIFLNPITSKGLVGNCELQIPKENLQEMVAKEHENFFQKKREANEAFSISDLTDCIIAGLSKIKDDEH